MNEIWSLDFLPKILFCVSGKQENNTDLCANDDQIEEAVSPVDRWSRRAVVCGLWRYRDVTHCSCFVLQINTASDAETQASSFFFM